MGAVVMMEMRVGQLLYVKKMISNVMLGISKYFNPFGFIWCYLSLLTLRAFSRCKPTEWAFSVRLQCEFSFRLFPPILSVGNSVGSVILRSSRHLSVWAKVWEQFVIQDFPAIYECEQKCGTSVRFETFPPFMSVGLVWGTVWDLSVDRSVRSECEKQCESACAFELSRQNSKNGIFLD